MTNETHGPETESLGELLEKTRKKLNLDLEQVARDTKISMSKLRAMEADDYNSLPADAFARGFYSLYARALRLNPEDIVQRFFKERGRTPHPVHDNTTAAPPHKVAMEVHSMAEPSNVSPLSTLGVVLLLLILIGAGLCWYFSINPVTYVSEKLRSLNHVQTQKVVPNTIDGPTTKKDSGPSAVIQPQATTPTAAPSSQPSMKAPKSQPPPTPASTPAATPAPAKAANTKSGEAAPTDDPAKTATVATAQASKYHLVAKFVAPTTLRIQVDDKPGRERTFEAGETASWDAKQSMILYLPKDCKAQLILNDIPLTLPKNPKKEIRISLPEYLLD